MIFGIYMCSNNRYRYTMNMYLFYAKVTLF